MSDRGPQFILSTPEGRIAVDDRGRLQELTCSDTGRNYAAGGPLVRLIFQRGSGLENAAEIHGVQPEIFSDASSLTIRYPRLDTLAARVEIRIVLREDGVRWSVDLENQDPGTMIRECFFPLLSPCRRPSDHALITSEMGGHRYEDPNAEIEKHRSLYMALDEYGPVKTCLYPGSRAAMNCFLLAGEREGLYVASHDPSLQYTQHYFRLVHDTIEVGLVKYPFLAAGQKTTLDGYVVWPYAGTWRRGADRYRSWAQTWCRNPAVDRPAWVGRMNGWQRLILRHQYGEVLTGYPELYRAFRDGADAGVSGLLIFGWHDQGHDANYPHYPFDETQGGRAELARQIRAIQADGGRALLYFNGQLIERDSAYYQTIGKRICIKDHRGNEVVKQYHFSGKGTLLPQFGNRTFVDACPTSEEWFDHLTSLCDIGLDLGVDSIFFDQLGGSGNVLCCDPTHGHPVPFATIGAAKRLLLSRLRAYLRERNPEVALGTEIVCDSTMGEADYLHGYTGGCGPVGPVVPGQPVKTEGFPELFRYTFPDLVYSDREIRDDTDIPRRVAHALKKGLISDVEIYRCRATIAETPTYRTWLKEINRLRDRWADLLLEGEYRDTEGFTLDTTAVDARCFVRGSRLAIVASQHHAPHVGARLSVPGYRLADHDGAGRFHVKSCEEGVDLGLGKDAVAVCVFEIRGLA